MQTPAHHMTRHIAFEGASNFRDLGGYQNQNGECVRQGIVYRSARLNPLSTADLNVFATLNIRSICDFRGDEERQEKPTQLPIAAPPDIHHLTIPASITDEVMALYHANNLTGQAAHNLMMKAYQSYVTEHVAVYRKLFDLLTDPANQPLLFHCTAGKDRTGVAAALILSALDIDRDTILHDYLLTNELWDNSSADRKGLPDDVCDALLSVRADYLNVAFDVIESEHGSVDRFLEVGLGVDAKRRELLRKLLLEKS